MHDDDPIIDTTAAERAVIGACIESPDSYRWAEHLSPDEFSSARIGLVWEQVKARRAAKEPVDIASMDSVLARAIPGYRPGDVFSLIDQMPGGGTTRGWADQIAEGAKRRQLIAAGTRARQNAAQADLAEALAIARRDIEEIGKASTSTIQARPLARILEESDAYDWLIPNLIERQDRAIFTGSEGGGKALALDTPIPTPTGWTTMGAIQPGDQVLGADGKPTTVTFATEVQLDRDCYRVEFSDGTSIIADADHNWLTETYASRTRASRRLQRGETKGRGTDQRHKRQHFPAVVTTREIAETLRARGGHTLNHSIDAPAPLDLPDAELTIPPYTLGAWLGDGISAGGRICIGDEDKTEMLANLADDGWSVTPNKAKYMYGIAGLQVKLREVGVLNNKHIPIDYLRASYGQRLALLQGLMDTDGTVSGGGAKSGRGHGSAKCEFSVVSERLARDVHELILSLGIIATLRSGDATLNGRVVGTRWRIQFQTEQPAFRLSRKAERVTPLRTQRSRHRFVTAVVPVESVPVRCIQVDNADRLYLAGRQMVPTHNTTLVRQLAILSAAGVHPFTFEAIQPVRVLVIDAENTERQWRRATRGIVAAASRQTGQAVAERIPLACTPRLDVTRERHMSAIHRLIDEHTPDMVFIGPLYKLVPRAIQSDDDAAPVLSALDSLRDRGVALVMEAHAGHGQSMQGKRDLRPRGSSALLGWPEFGIGLRLDEEHPMFQANPNDYRNRKVDLVRWRGDRDQRSWPGSLYASGIFPWSP